jgi:hypothetical protein
VPDAPHIFGIRHHGPGSARSLLAALEALSPDGLLIEGPPEAEAVLARAAHPEMKPPVALLIYDPEQPQRAAYYPLAAFSPEWQAIQFGLARGVPVRFMDLPQAVQMGLQAEEEARTEAGSPPPASGPDALEEAAPSSPPSLRLDPLAHLAQAAGHSDSERWWEQLVEHRRDSREVFTAILEAMTALRDAALTSGLQEADMLREQRREAHMRQAIRAAQKEGCQRLAVVCGAWHAPALAKPPPAKDDAALLKGLPRRKVAATWVPWTYGRLAQASGYGAGIESPGWYDFLWHLRPSAQAARSATVATDWLVNVARLLRDEGLDASSAGVIEAVRLAEALAALRQRPLPGLPELNEATQAVLCSGEELPLRLIGRKLIVSERLGEVPDETPAVPLAQDLAREQKRLRLPPEASQRPLDLDLRKANDLDRSRLLHRLNLLGVPWGKAEHRRGAQQGTFHELWRVQWQPEFAVALIEAGVWGNTLEAAAAARVRQRAEAAADLPELTGLLDATLLADLPAAAEQVMDRVQAVAAVASDVTHLMAALAPLAGILRYGNVRQTDAAMVAGVVDGLVTRIAIGLPGACGSLNDEAAGAMFEHLLATHGAVALLQHAGHAAAWHAVLRQLADSPNLHGLVAGRACRLLLEARQLEAAEAARRLGLALSAANRPDLAAAWVDGFLRASGLLLLHDDALWHVLDGWLTALAPDHFTAVLPLLRRTFSTFAAAERRQMGARAADGPARTRVAAAAEAGFDEARADQALPLLAQLLGLR